MSSPVETNASWSGSPLLSMLKSPRAMRLWSQLFTSLVHRASHSAISLISGTLVFVLPVEDMQRDEDKGLTS